MQVFVKLNRTVFQKTYWIISWNCSSANTNNLESEWLMNKILSTLSDIMNFHVSLSLLLLPLVCSFTLHHDSGLQRGEVVGHWGNICSHFWDRDTHQTASLLILWCPAASPFISSYPHHSVALSFICVLWFPGSCCGGSCLPRWNHKHILISKSPILQTTQGKKPWISCLFFFPFTSPP